MDYETIQYTVNGKTAILMLSRPQAMNALNRTLIDELDRAIDEIADNPAISAVIIGGEKNFAAGADITSMVEMDPAAARAFAFTPTYLKIENLPKPTIAAISGFALGGGLELALACDLRIAGPDAKLAFPEINIGVFPGAGGTQRLPRLIGPARAKELIYLGTMIDAQTALAYGLVNSVAENPLDAALKIAAKLASKSSVVLSRAKECLNFAAEAGLREGMEIEAEKWGSLFTTADQREGMRAFLEKRKPVFTGK
jgi:enoyl-CoA hydratase